MSLRTVAFVSTTYPYPSDNGKKTAIAGFLQFLAETVGSNNVRYLLLGDPPRHPDPALSTVVVPMGSSTQRVASVCWHSLFLRRRSLQEALLYTSGVRRRLRARIAELDPDIVILDTIRIGQFFEDALRIAPHRRWVLYMEDLFSRRYRQLARDLRQGGAHAATNPLGAFAYAVPAPLRPLARSASLRTMLYRFEETLVWRSEKRMAAALRRVCLVNDAEIACLAEHVPEAKISHTPPCIPVPSMDRNAGAHEGPFLILGALDYPPNAIAVTEFLTQAMPLIVRQMPDARIRIVGKRAAAELVTLAGRWAPHAELVGYVPDLAALMASAAAMIVPVRVGSGPKLKSLEALAHGLPLITTRNGIEAIAALPNVHCFVSDDLRRFPAFMQQLRDPAANRAMSRHCRVLFNSEYSAGAVHPRYSSAFLGVDI